MANVIYRQHKDIIYRQEGDEAILFNPDTSDIIVFNQTGCFIWSLCNGKRTQKDIARTMIDEYDVDTKTAEKDLLKFFSDLEKKSFIEKTQE